MTKTDINAVTKDLTRRMEGAIEVLHKEFAGLRTGRAAPTLLDPVMVEAYGSSLPMNQVGTIGVPEPRMLTVHVWDKSLVKAVERAILAANLGLNPQADGQLLRIPIPNLTEERRKELARVAHKYAEDARVAIRNIRRHGMEELKRADKDGDISKDEHHDFSKAIQELTDGYVGKIDAALAKKEQEIMQV